MKKVIALITAGLVAVSLTAICSAIQLSDTNKDIEIVYGEYTGYRFNGPDAPIGEIDTAKIAKVKFYIKCPGLETIDEAIVELVYNSGTTNWIETEHDLNDGLIVEIDVPGVVAGDFFDAAIGTWNEAIEGTFSVEVLDSQGNVLGEGVYSNQPDEPDESTTTGEVGSKDGEPSETTTSESTASETETTTSEPDETTSTETSTSEELPKDGTTASDTTVTSELPKDGTVTSPDTTVTSPATSVTTVTTEGTGTVAGAQETELATNTAERNVATGSALVSVIIGTAISMMAVASTRKKR